MGMPTTPFDDLDEFLALPRVSGLAVSPDGSRVVTSIAELNDKRTEFVNAIWELDPAGSQPARRLTRGAKGESSPAFTADGDLLFVAARPTADDDNPPASLWRLPAAGGKPSKRWRCRVALRPFAPPVQPPPRWSPRSCWARPPASRTTSDCEHSARTT